MIAQNVCYEKLQKCYWSQSRFMPMCVIKFRVSKSSTTEYFFNDKNNNTNNNSRALKIFQIFCNVTREHTKKTMNKKITIPE